MTKPVVYVSPDATLEEAARIMATCDIGDLPVCEGDQLRGIITDRDIVVRGLSKGINPKDAKVEDIMTSGLECCFNDEDLRKILKRMENKGIRRMVVIDHDKKLTGIFSIGDVAIRGDEKLAAEALHRISEQRRSRTKMLGE